jgi:hypothetical protein
MITATFASLETHITKPPKKFKIYTNMLSENDLLCQLSEIDYPNIFYEFVNNVRLFNNLSRCHLLGFELASLRTL